MVYDLVAMNAENTAERLQNAHSDVDVLQLPELRQGTVLIKCGGDGKDPSTLFVSIDLHNNVLNMRSGSGGELKQSLDISCIKVKAELIECSFDFAYACAIPSSFCAATDPRI